MEAMRTSLRELFDLRVPLVLAPFGPWDQVELAAAVCRAGALGSIGTAVRSVDELEAQWHRLRDLTDRPFVINHTGRPFNQDAFDATLAFGPAAISFHMGVAPELIAAAHERSIVWLQTVGDVDAAEQAIEAGADILVAQGTEAGGNAGWVTTMVLVPLSSMSPVRSPSSLPVASPTVAASPQRWRSAPKASAWVPDSSRRPR
jgi:enoyl-[acyl-carrier protein] reductase II